ncbi:MAG: hypothetical protein ACREFI_07055, partial [Stellaceae bacterium]
MIKTVLAAVAAIPLSLTAPVSAQPLAQPPAWAAPGILEAQDVVLSEPELRNALESAGYSEIHILQENGDMYDMSAQNGGRPVLLRAD